MNKFGTKSYNEPADNDEWGLLKRRYLANFNLPETMRYFEEQKERGSIQICGLCDGAGHHATACSVKTRLDRFARASGDPYEWGCIKFHLWYGRMSQEEKDQMKAQRNRRKRGKSWKARK